MRQEKRWSKPQLIVLVRGYTQESVLTACKGSGAGPSSYDASCEGDYKEAGVCVGSCSDSGSS